MAAVGLDKNWYQINIFLLFLYKNVCCGYLLEAPRRGASNEYPQHMFSWRNKKTVNTFGSKKHLIKSYMRTSTYILKM